MSPSVSPSGSPTSPLTVLIVDDEMPARARLRRMLGRIEGVTIAGEAADGREALERIRASPPDAVLLDIRMPELDGLAVAEAVAGTTHIIFTTAYDEYAVQAFEAAAVDYLLKPISTERLETALDRVRELQGPADRDRIEELLRSIAPPREALRIAARAGDTLRVFDPTEITRFTADGGYTLFQHEGRRYVADETLTALAKRLGPADFLRVHRKELVNLKRVRAILRIDDATVVELTDGQRASVSRRATGELKRALGLADGS